MKEEKPFKKLTYKLAVIAKCRQCCCGSIKAVKECSCTDCALHSYRLGKPPKSPINALELTIFTDDPNSKIFRLKKGASEDDDPISDKEYSDYIEDDEE